MTLRHFRAKPALSLLDMRYVPVSEVMRQYKDVRSYLDKVDGCAVAHPEVDAISFYLANAAYAKVVQRVAEDDPLNDYALLVSHYEHTVRVASLRLFFYLLLICTRESRHIQTNNSLYASLDAAYGCMSFTKSLKGLDPFPAANVLINTPPNYPLGLYTDHLVRVFYDGSFSSGYGGKKWADIARVLRNFVHGVTSAELMLDTGFTLAHNGGPIFNKEMLYKHYDQEELVKILDVQRAGQVPQLIVSNASKFITDSHRVFHATARSILGGEFAGAVDWDLVESLGAAQKYTKEKLGQKKKQAPSAKTAATPKPDSLFVTPTLQVQKSSVKRAA